MKKFLCSVIAIFLVFFIVGCGESSEVVLARKISKNTTNLLNAINNLEEITNQDIQINEFEGQYASLQSHEVSPYTQTKVSKLRQIFERHNLVNVKDITQKKQPRFMDTNQMTKDIKDPVKYQNNLRNFENGNQYNSYKAKYTTSENQNNNLDLFKNKIESLYNACQDCGYVNSQCNMKQDQLKTSISECKTLCEKLESGEIKLNEDELKQCSTYCNQINSYCNSLKDCKGNCDNYLNTLRALKSYFGSNSDTLVSTYSSLLGVLENRLNIYNGALECVNNCNNLLRNCESCNNNQTNNNGGYNNYDINNVNNNINNNNTTPYNQDKENQNANKPKSNNPNLVNNNNNNNNNNTNPNFVNPNNPQFNGYNGVNNGYPYNSNNFYNGYNGFYNQTPNNVNTYANGYRNIDTYRNGQYPNNYQNGFNTNYAGNENNTMIEKENNKENKIDLLENQNQTNNNLGEERFVKIDDNKNEEYGISTLPLKDESRPIVDFNMNQNLENSEKEDENKTENVEKNNENIENLENNEDNKILDNNENENLDNEIENDLNIENNIEKNDENENESENLDNENIDKDFLIMEEDKEKLIENNDIISKKVEENSDILNSGELIYNKEASL